MVGPFVFFDQMGPAEFLVGNGLDVRPHPHIGLATVTYLFDGAITHRDSLGTHQVIKPGDVNLMTAGRGIAHSERDDQPEVRSTGGKVSSASRPGRRYRRPTRKPHLHLHTTMLANCRGSTVTASGAPGDGPKYRPGITGRISARSFFAEAVLAPGAVLPLDADYDERAVYIVSGEIDIAGQSFGPGRLLVFKPGDRISILANSNARLMLLGGEPMDGPRHIWWNFVSSSADRIDAAKADWKARRLHLFPETRPSSFRCRNKGRTGLVTGDREAVVRPVTSNL